MYDLLGRQRPTTSKTLDRILVNAGRISNIQETGILEARQNTL